MGKLKNAITIWRLTRAMKKESKKMSSETKQYSVGKGALKSTKTATIVGFNVAGVMKAVGDKIPLEYADGLSDALYVVVSAAAAFGIEFLRNFVKTKYDIEIKGLLVVALAIGLLSPLTGCAFGKDQTTGLWRFMIFPDEAQIAAEIGASVANSASTLYQDLAKANADIDAAQTDAERQAAQERRDAIMSAIDKLKPDVIGGDKLTVSGNAE